MAFGTDGDKNLTEALGHNLPFALQLRCFIHFKKSVQEKLRDLCLPSLYIPAVLDDIFGKHDGNLKIEGLVDSRLSTKIGSSKRSLEYTRVAIC